MSSSYEDQVLGAMVAESPRPCRPQVQELDFSPDDKLLATLGGRDDNMVRAHIADRSLA
jgi:hypothetical protein